MLMLIEGLPIDNPKVRKANIEIFSTTELISNTEEWYWYLKKDGETIIPDLNNRGPFKTRSEALADVLNRLID